MKREMKFWEGMSENDAIASAKIVTVGEATDIEITEEDENGSYKQDNGGGEWAKDMSVWDYCVCVIKDIASQNEYYKELSDRDYGVFVEDNYICFTFWNGDFGDVHISFNF